MINQIFEFTAYLLQQMRNNQIFWILVVFLITVMCDSGAQQSLTLVSTQPKDKLVKNQTETRVQSIHNNTQSLHLNTTKLRKAIEQTQNSKNKQNNTQKPSDNLNEDKPKDSKVEPNQVSESKFQSAQKNDNHVSNDTSTEDENEEKQLQKKEEHIKNYYLSNQPKIPIQIQSSQKNKQISMQINNQRQNLKKQQTVLNNSSSQNRQTKKTLTNDKKDQVKEQINEKIKQQQKERNIHKEVEKSKGIEGDTQQSKNLVLFDRKQAQQKKNNFKIGDIVPIQQFQSLVSLKPVLSNMKEENTIQGNKRQTKETNQQASETNNITSGLRLPQKTIFFKGVVPEIPINSLNITLPNINLEPVIKSTLKSEQKQKSKNQQNILKENNKKPQISSNQTKDISEQSQTTPKHQKIKQVQKIDQAPISKNNTQSTDSYIKWPKDKALKSQAQNKGTYDTSLKSENQTAKRIEQRGKVMKNPKESLTPLNSEDKPKPKQQLAAKKKIIIQENKIPEPTQHSSDSYIKQAQDESLTTQDQNKKIGKNNQIAKKAQNQQTKKIQQKVKVMKNSKQNVTALIPEDKGKKNQPKTNTNYKKIQPQSAKIIQQNQVNDNHRSGKRGKSSAKTQEQIQRMKERIKMRKQKKNNDRQAYKNVKNNNLKQQVLLNKLQSQQFKEKRNKDKQKSLKKPNLLDKQAHLTHQNSLDLKKQDIKQASKTQLQNKKLKNIEEQQQQTEKALKQNRKLKVYKKQNNQTSQFLSQLSIYLILLAIAVGIYFYSNRKKQPVLQIKGSQGRLKDSEEDEIQIAQRVDEEG